MSDPSPNISPLDGHRHLWAYDDADGSDYCASCGATREPINPDCIRDHVGEDEDE